jgi:ABC-type sulfate transport system permease component
MEDLKTIAVSDEADSASHTSLAVAVTVWLASFLFAFTQSWAIVTGFDHPAALSLAIAEAIQTSTFFPTVHVGIASLFKSMRNPSSRRRIFIGWGILTILLCLWTTWRS